MEIITGYVTPSNQKTVKVRTKIGEGLIASPLHLVLFKRTSPTQTVCTHDHFMRNNSMDRDNKATPIYSLEVNKVMYNLWQECHSLSTKALRQLFSWSSYTAHWIVMCFSPIRCLFCWASLRARSIFDHTKYIWTAMELVRRTSACGKDRKDVPNFHTFEGHLFSSFSSCLTTFFTAVTVILANFHHEPRFKYRRCELSEHLAENANRSNGEQSVYTLSLAIPTDNSTTIKNQ